ncbi:hypothetical protein Cgig2_013435 [Carnegiea gigantea]|uniref:Uncharacterized protein n=1 Tax=Carnegiea gigantea TaxID=171969 RepID=A0A9Q1QDK5_9CARY|nr:hypothetical protein Cgig2_013435 [Carnegiea gigantea]
MGVLDVLRLVEEVMGEHLRGRLMWYSLKCNQMELLPLGRDADMGKLMKGNDEYAYVYVAGSEGPCVGGLQGKEAYKGQGRGVGVLKSGSSPIVSTQAVTLASTSGSSESDCSCDCYAMENYTYNCGLEADIFEGDGQYRRRYVRCPKRDEVACDFFHLIDVDFPERVKEVIDDLVRKQIVQRDWLLDDYNAELLTRDEDMCMEAERRAEVDTLKKLLGLAVAVIAIMLAIGM